MSEIPRPELDTLILTAVEATVAAEEGNPGEGYTMLLSGRHRAQEVSEDGEPWAAELLARWQQAVEAFAFRWGVGRA